jgi:phenylacetate-CoA ligase
MTTPFRKAYWNAFTLWHARHERTLPYRPVEHIQAVQDRRVRAIVAHAYETVPYYQELMNREGLRPDDFRTTSDLAKLPILTGDQVAARAPADFLSRHYPADQCLRIDSSGTSGRAKSIYYDHASLFLALAHGHRQRVALTPFVGRTVGYRELNAIRAASVAVQLRRFYESHSLVPGSIDLKRNHLSPADGFAENVKHINAFQPEVIRGYGSYIGALFRWASEQGLSVFRTKAIVYGADRMADADRLLIETHFGTPVLSTYQAVEALRIGFQCERREGFHISADQVAVRVVNKNGSAVGPGGTGEIVLSNLTNRATVLLNYKLGDVVTVGQAGCPCGRTLPTIERIQGRSDDSIVLPDGEVKHSLIVMESLQAVPGVVQIQLVQHDVRRFALRVVGGGDVDRSDAKRKLQAALIATLGNHFSLDVEWVDEIPPGPSGKVKAVISHCRA